MQWPFVAVVLLNRKSERARKRSCRSLCCATVTTVNIDSTEIFNPRLSNLPVKPIKMMVFIAHLSGIFPESSRIDDGPDLVEAARSNGFNALLIGHDNTYPEVSARITNLSAFLDFIP